jgi:hypothetical protein
LLIDLRYYIFFNPTASDVYTGDKVLLPGSVFKKLQDINAPLPYLFKIYSPDPHHKQFVYATVREFSTDEGMCALPPWVFAAMAQEPGSRVVVSVQRLPRGVSATFEPSVVVDLSDAKAALESQLSAFATLTVGTAIPVVLPPTDPTAAAGRKVRLEPLDMTLTVTHVHPPEYKVQRMSSQTHCVRKP